MKIPILISVLALILSAIGLEIILGRSPAPPSIGTDSALTPAGSEADLLARVQALTAENHELRGRLEALELRPAAGSAQRLPLAGTFLPRGEFDAFVMEVRDALEERSGSSMAAVVKDPGFKDELVGTLQEINAEKAALAREARRQSQLDRLDGMMPKLEVELGLSAAQSGDLRSELAARYERDAELTQRWKAGEDGATLGEVKRSNHETHQAELSRILTPQQLESYRGALRAVGGGK